MIIIQKDASGSYLFENFIVENVLEVHIFQDENDIFVKPSATTLDACCGGHQRQSYDDEGNQHHHGLVDNAVKIMIEIQW